MIGRIFTILAVAAVAAVAAACAPSTPVPTPAPLLPTLAPSVSDTITGLGVNVPGGDWVKAHGRDCVLFFGGTVVPVEEPGTSEVAYRSAANIRVMYWLPLSAPLMLGRVEDQREVGRVLVTANAASHPVGTRRAMSSGTGCSQGAVFELALERYRAMQAQYNAIRVRYDRQLAGVLALHKSDGSLLVEPTTPEVRVERFAWVSDMSLGSFSTTCSVDRDAQTQFVAVVDGQPLHRVLSRWRGSTGARCPHGTIIDFDNSLPDLYYLH